LSVPTLRPQPFRTFDVRICTRNKSNRHPEKYNLTGDAMREKERKRRE
jgi:hypothetical protein